MAVISAAFLSPAIVASDSPAFNRLFSESSEIPRVDVIALSMTSRFLSITPFAAALASCAALVIASAWDWVMVPLLTRPESRDEIAALPLPLSADATAVAETFSTIAVAAIAATNFLFINPLFFKYLLHLMRVDNSLLLWWLSKPPERQVRVS